MGRGVEAMAKGVEAMAKSKDWQREVEKVLHYPTYYYQSFRLLDGDLLTAREQRQELRRLLAVANKRQKRLRESRAFKDSYAARRTLPKMSELRTDRDVSRALADVALFIRSRRSTVSGATAYRAEVAATLGKTFAGVAEVNFDDPDFKWKAFGRYMQQMKKSGKAHEGADSEKAVQMYFIARKIGLTPAGLRDNYNEFLSRQDEMLALYNNNPFGRRNTSGADMLARLDSLQR